MYGLTDIVKMNRNNKEAKRIVNARDTGGQREARMKQDEENRRATANLPAPQAQK